MRRANQFIGKGNNHSLPFYGGKRKRDERLVLDQFLIARLGRSWTTYGRAIPSRDYFRIADIHDKSVSRGQKLSRRASEKRVHKIPRASARVRASRRWFLFD